MDIVEKLKKIGFTESMAQVYIELLKNPGYNGTQIFKNLELPRSSIYKALDDLLDQNIIMLIPSNENLKNYNPVNPVEIVNRFNKEYIDIFKNLSIELESIYNPNEFYEVYNISGIDNIYYKLNEMIKKAKKNIVISGKFFEERILEKTNLDILKINGNNENELYIIIDDEELLVSKINNIYAVGFYTKNSIIIEKYR